jgi:hypothetical protein
VFVVEIFNQETMDTLPNELFGVISLHLNDTDKALLSFTCRRMKRLIRRRLLLLRSCLEDRNVGMMKMALNWNNIWTQDICFALGRKDNVGIFNIFFPSFTGAELAYIAIGATEVDNSKVLSYMHCIFGSIKEWDESRLHKEYRESVTGESSFSNIQRFKEMWFAIFTRCVDRRDSRLFIHYLSCKPTDVSFKAESDSEAQKWVTRQTALFRRRIVL